jgi:hypothetical protein
MRELFPAAGALSQTDEAVVSMLESLQNAIPSLTPADEIHRWLRSQALALSDGMAQARWLLVQQTGNGIPLPFLALLIFWRGIVFARFGLFAPPNSTGDRCHMLLFRGGFRGHHDDPGVRLAVLGLGPHFRRAMRHALA